MGGPAAELGTGPIAGPTSGPATELTTADRLELHELLARLCHAFDLGPPERVPEAFVADGVFAMVSSVATGEEPRYQHQGSAELLAFAEQMADRRQGLWRHWTGNVVLEATPDGGARAVSYVLFLQVDADTGERRIPVSGVHRDEFVRTDAGWRFRSRTVVPDR